MAKNNQQPPKINHRRLSWRPLLKKIANTVADSPLPAIAAIATFILSRWWNNSDFSYPKEVIVPIALFAVLISAIFYIYRWILRPGLAPHIATLILAWCLYSYSHLVSTSLGRWLLDAIPDRWRTELSESITAALLIGLIAGLVGWGVGRVVARSTSIQKLQPYKVMMFALLFIFVVQLVRTGQRLWDMSDQLAYDYPALQLPEPKAQPTAKPDIYYLVFDRYGNQSALAQNYNFDNSELYKFLESKGFTSRPEAYANYPFTMSSVSSTLAMSYFPEFEQMFADDGEWQSASPYRDILNNPPLAQILLQNGYSYNQVSSWWDFTRVGIKADSQPTKSFRLRVLGSDYYLSDLQRDILNKSILSPWLKKGVSLGSFPVLKYDLNRNPRQNFEAQLSALQQVSDRSDKSRPQFSFAHVLVPHDPYIFTANGSTPTYDNNRTDNGADETLKYTNQVTYLNTRIRDLVSHIQKASPEAVIIIQADEGPYPKEFRFKLEPGHYYDPQNLSQQKMRQKFSILASYYFPGAVPNEQPVSSSVNVFRYVLNRYLGYSLPMLPDCHLSTGDKYTVYNYKEVSEELTGRPAPAGCKQYDPL